MTLGRGWVEREEEEGKQCSIGEKKIKKARKRIHNQRETKYD